MDLLLVVIFSNFIIISATIGMMISIMRARYDKGHPKIKSLRGHLQTDFII